MKFKFSLAILMAILFTFSSCQKEENSNTQEEKVHVSTSLDTRSFNGDITHPFYQTEYVKNELQINLPRVVSTPRIYDLMNEIHSLPYHENLVSTLVNRNYFPCWSCGEADYSEPSEMVLTIVPIVDISNSKVVSLLVREEIQEVVSIKYVDVELLTFSETQNLDIPNNYYQRIVTYFEKLIINETVNWFVYKNFLNEPCIYSSNGGTCSCEKTRVECYGNGPLGEQNYCDEIKCGTSGGTSDSVHDGGATDGGTATPPPVPLFWTWVVFINSYGPNFIDPDFPPLGGGANTTSTTQNDFEDIFKVLETIHELINYIKVDRQLPLNQATIDILKDFDYFQLLTIPLHGTIENLTDDQILAFLEFITNHPNFIKSEEESLYLQFDNVFTGLLNDYLLENNSNKAKEIAHATLQGYTTGSFTSGYRDVLANMRDLLQLTTSNISLVFTDRDIIWLLNNKIALSEIINIDQTYPDDQSAGAAIQTYTRLASLNLLDLTYNQVKSNSDANSTITSNMHNFGFVNHLAISSSYWYSIFQAEAYDHGGSPLAWLQAIKDAIDQAMDQAVSLIVQQLSTFLQNTGIELPQTLDEWKAFGAIMWSVIDENAIYLIPYIGDAVGFRDDFEDLMEGNNWGLLGMTASLLAVIPVGQIIKKLGNVIDILKLGFRGFNTARKVLTQVWRFLDNGIELVVETSQIILKKGGATVGKIADDLVHVNFSGFGGNVISHPTKTTTAIGNWSGGTGQLIDSGLTKSGRNPKGINVLNEVIPPAHQNNPDWIWDNVNEPWLNDAISNGDVIRAVSDPTITSNVSLPNGALRFFGREHEHLIANGYIFDSITKTYIK